MRLLRTFVVTALVLAACATASGGDIVITTDGKKQGNPKAGDNPSEADFAASTWNISEENLDTIVYSIEGVPGKQTFPTNKVRRIFHDPSNTPPDLVRGLALLDAGRYAEARDALAKVDRAEDPLWAKHEALFRIGDSYWLEGEYARAAEALGRFKQQAPKSMYLPLATEHRARALLATGKSADAKQEFAAMRGLAGVPDDVAAQAEYWAIWIDEQVALEKNDAAGLASALKAYEALASRSAGKTGLESVTRRAQVGLASVLIAQGKAADARQALEKLAQETPDREKAVLAAIYTKLGNAIVRESAQSGTKEGYKQALLHFLRVVTLYSTDEGTDEETAEALYRAGEMFRELRSGTDKEQAAEFGRRWRREWNDLTQRFPNSNWAKRAKAEGGGS